MSDNKQPVNYAAAQLLPPNLPVQIEQGRHDLAPDQIAGATMMVESGAIVFQ
jgi:hypothetical protein